MLLLRAAAPFSPSAVPVPPGDVPEEEAEEEESCDDNGACDSDCKIVCMVFADAEIDGEDADAERAAEEGDCDTDGVFDATGVDA